MIAIYTIEPEVNVRQTETYYWFDRNLKNFYIWGVSNKTTTSKFFYFFYFLYSNWCSKDFKSVLLFSIKMGGKEREIFINIQPH